MKKRNNLLAVFLLVLLCSCSSGITRYGYELQDLNNLNSSADCRISIKDNMPYDKADTEILGSIKAYDTGLSVRCDEAYVLSIFCKDACALGADVVNITQERYPSFWSSCYRAKAEFLFFKNREQAKSLHSDWWYEPEMIVESSKETARRNKMAIEAGIMGGMLGGMMSSPK